MTITKSTGLFYTEQLKTNEGIKRNVFCQPVDIKIFSAPYPAKYRLVAYRIKYWDDTKQPDIAVDMPNAKTYKSERLSEEVFTFTTGTIQTTIDNLTTLIRRHFLEIVAVGGAFRDLREGIRRLHHSSLATDKVYTKDDRLLELCNVRHIERIDHNDEFIYTFKSSVMIYNIALIDDPNKVGIEDIPAKREFQQAYTSNRSIMAAVVEDFNNFIAQ